jgi:plasmid maintenance system antidote protein VapI
MKSKEQIASVTQPQQLPQPDVSPLVPRRSADTQGRRPLNFPNLNYQVVGAAIGVSSTFIGRILNGRSRCSMSVAHKLAAYLGWSLDQIAALYKPKPKPKVEKQKQTEKESNGKSRNSRTARTGTSAAATAGNAQSNRRPAPDAASRSDKTKSRKSRRKTGTAAA